MNKPDYLIDIKADDYHAATKRNEYTTSHRLNLYRRCPKLYKKIIDGDIVEGDTATFILGRATHTAILEGAKTFAEEYTVDEGPTNPKTGKAYGKTTKAYIDWAAAQPKPVISPEDCDLIDAMDKAVHAHEVATDILKSGIAEATVRTEWNGEPVQARIDWLDVDRGLIADLKTCDDLDKFRYNIRDFGYVTQLAFYERCLVLAGYKGPKLRAYLIAVEKREPYRVGVFEISASTLEDGNFAEPGAKYGAGNDFLINALKESRASDCWPTLYEGVQIV